jgi:ribosomal RNA-processing protein 12
LSVAVQIQVKDKKSSSSTLCQAEIYKVIPETLLCLKDSNGKTRDGAYQLLLSLASRGDIVEFVKVIVAALGAKTSHMRSAVVMALSRIVFELGWENDEFHALLPELLKTVLVLIDEGSREVTKSVVGFIRISVAAIHPNQLEPLLPDLIGSLLKSQHAKSRFRAKIKIILKKLVKAYGYETLMPFVPESEKRLLTHMRKLGEREKRKKQAQSSSRRPEVDQFDAMVDSDEDDSDDGRTYMTGMTGKSRLATAADDKTVASARTKQSATGTVLSGRSKLDKHAKVRLPNESDGVIVDMLDSTITKRVQFAAEDDNDSDSDAAMEFDDDGKLVVPGDDKDEKMAAEPDEELAMNDQNKRRRLTKTGDDASRRKKGQNSNSLGASYKSRKAGGDVQKKGQKFEPYAFVPLDGRAYSKKNRRKAVEQMTSVVRKGGKRKR